MKDWKTKARQAFERYMEDLELSLEAGSGLAEIERAMLRHNPELLRTLMQGLVEETQAPSPPLELPKGWRRVGQRTSQVRSSWGFIQVRVQRLRDEAGREHSYRLDGSLDGSGYTPWVLERLLELAGRLPYEEAAELGRAFGLEVSRPIHLPRPRPNGWPNFGTGKRMSEENGIFTGQ